MELAEEEELVDDSPENHVSLAGPSEKKVDFALFFFFFFCLCSAIRPKCCSAPLRQFKFLW